jgi:protein-disulfide isomerase
MVFCIQIFINKKYKRTIIIMKKTLIAVLSLLSFNASAQDFTQFMEGDIIEGSITAPVTVIEYASMTCGHCANFDKNVVQPLKADYVAKGKVAYTLRDMPLDQLAYAVSKVQRCVPNEQYYKLTQAFFAYQSQWLSASDKLGAIKNIAKLGGLTSDQVEACIRNDKIQQTVEDMRNSGIALGVDSTPTVFVNGKKYVGISSYEKLKTIIDAELAK